VDKYARTRETTLRAHQPEFPQQYARARETPPAACPRADDVEQLAPAADHHRELALELLAKIAWT
jgi:hypothetical protein